MDERELQVIEERLGEDAEPDDDCWWHDSDAQMRLRPSHIRALIAEVRRLRAKTNPEYGTPEDAIAMSVATPESGAFTPRLR